MDNRLQIGGVIGNEPQTRHSPAGIPITRFTLMHQSEQCEAGLQRQVVCNIGVVVSGVALEQAVKQLETGMRIRVSGFLARANNRQGEHRLILHADSIETIDANREHTKDLR